MGNAGTRLPELSSGHAQLALHVPLLQVIEPISPSAVSLSCKPLSQTGGSGGLPACGDYY